MYVRVIRRRQVKVLGKYLKSTLFLRKKAFFVIFDVQDGTHSHFCGNCVILNAELKLDKGWERGFSKNNWISGKKLCCNYPQEVPKLRRKTRFLSKKVTFTVKRLLIQVVSCNFPYVRQF